MMIISCIFQSGETVQLTANNNQNKTIGSAINIPDYNPQFTSSILIIYFVLFKRAVR